MESEIQFHKIWIAQCEATERIKEDFGLQSALSYLIGEKLLHFLAATDQHPEFAAELPKFVQEIRRIFTPQQICGYLDDLERTKFLSSPEPEDDYPEDDLEDEFEDEFPSHPVLGAQELLRFARMKELLQAEG